jgi:hypothetical protein
MALLILTKYVRLVTERANSCMSRLSIKQINSEKLVYMMTNLAASV